MTTARTHLSLKLLTSFQIFYVLFSIRRLCLYGLVLFLILLFFINWTHQTSLIYIVKKETFKGKEQILGLLIVRDEDFWKMSIWLFSGESEKETSGSPLKQLQFVHIPVSSWLKTVWSSFKGKTRIYALEYINL